MGYSLQAIIGRRTVLEKHAGDYTAVRVATLRQGFGLIPLVGELWTEIEGDEATDVRRRYRPILLWEEELPGPLVDWLMRMSHDGPVAYVEGECDAGPCDQESVVWSGGEMVLGPVRYEEGALNDIQPGKNRTRDGAINVALRFLGAERHWSIDEFAAVGLDSHRWKHDWLKEGGIEDAPDAETDDRFARFLRERGKWADVAPGRMASLSFRPDPSVIADARQILMDSGPEALDLGSDGPLKMPVALTLAGVEVTDSRPETDARWPLVYLAMEGLEFMRWAACGAHSLLRIVPGAHLWLYVRGGVAHLAGPGIYGWSEVPYADLVAGWETFSDEVRGYLRRELPELVGHAVCGAWLREEFGESG